MATQSDDRLPEWCSVESYRGVDFVDWRFRVILRCLDADVLILDVPQVTRHAPGRSVRMSITKLQLLQQLHEQITVALAKATLEQE